MTSWQPPDPVDPYQPGQPHYGQPQYGQPQYQPSYPPPQYGQRPASDYPPSQPPPSGAYGSPYGAPPGSPYPPAPGTNGLAIAALVVGIVWIYWLGSILALVFGYVARNQIKRTHQGGDGMAIAGIVLGWIGVGTLLIVIIIAAAASSNSGT